jgi:tetratricopeptide (TPR) repeat protein
VIYRAFITYSHRDQRWAAWLHRRLETYRLPKAIVGRNTAYGPVPVRLAPIFRDRDELGAATDLSAEITSALQRSLCLIVVCSRASAASQWVNEEIRTFKRLHGEDGVRAVIVDGEPFSPDPLRECFPEALRFRIGDDGAMTSLLAEPIAADLRPGGDGRRYAISKLVAGLTGVRLDELVQREGHRRTRRIGLVAGGASVVAVGMAALAVFALNQRDQARIQRETADIERTHAVEARDDAEGLIEFMLTDLRTRLEAVERLDVLDSVGQRALTYYNARPLDESGGDALGRRARAQLLVGQIMQRRGDLASALRAYQAGAATTQEQLARDPKNPQRIFDHAQSVFWAGVIARERGDATQAGRYMSEYLDYARALVAIDPERDDWQAELVYANGGLGVIVIEDGEASEAEGYFRKALELSSLRARKNPGNTKLLTDQADAYAGLADALEQQAKFAEARTVRTAEVTLLKAMVSSHAAAKQITAIAYEALASINLACGRMDDALADAETALMYASQLFAREPNDSGNVRVKSEAHRILGEIHLLRGELTDARRSIVSSVDMAERDIALDAVGSRNTLARSRLLAARIDAAQGRSGDALEQFGKIATDLEDQMSAIDVAAINGAALAWRARLLPQFSSSWTEVAAQLEPSAQKLGPATLALLAEAYERTGRADEAATIVVRLYHAGYRHPDFVAMLDRIPRLKRLVADHQ